MVMTPETRRGYYLQDVCKTAGVLTGQKTAAGGCFTRACIAVRRLRAQLEDVKGAGNAICVQVRDMTGDGSVIKRRIKDGRGEFPVDCPIEDSSVRVHYR